MEGSKCSGQSCLRIAKRMHLISFSYVVRLENIFGDSIKSYPFSSVFAPSHNYYEIGKQCTTNSAKWGAACHQVNLFQYYCIFKKFKITWLLIEFSVEMSHKKNNVDLPKHQTFLQCRVSQVFFYIIKSYCMGFLHLIGRKSLQEAGSPAGRRRRNTAETGAQPVTSMCLS